MQSTLRYNMSTCSRLTVAQGFAILNPSNYNVTFRSTETCIAVFFLPVLPCREVVVLVLNATFVWSRMYWTPRGPETWATKVSTLNSACHSGKIIWIPSNCRVLYVIICLHARAWQWHRGLLSRILQITMSCLEVQRRALLNLIPVLPWGEVVFLVFNATFLWSRMYWTHEIQKSELQSIGRWIKHVSWVIL